METRRGYREHQVADLVALIAGFASLAVAVWPMTIAGTGEGHEQFRDAFSVQMVHVSAGALAVLGVGLANFGRRALGKGLVALAGLVLLVGLLAARTAGPRVWMLLVLPALALLACSPFIGPLAPPGASELAGAPRGLDPPRRG